LGVTIARFTELAPDVMLSIHVASTNPIERGILDGTFQVGVVPSYRSSKALSYVELFGETMLLYCGGNHPLYGANHGGLTWRMLQSYAFSALGFVSPNMEISHRAGLSRKATAFDQEAIALLILSGRFPGFLPDHYAGGFVASGAMRMRAPGLNARCVGAVTFSAAT